MSEAQFLLYQVAGDDTRLLVRLEGETVWLTQAQMVELFQTSKQNISLHIRNIFDEGELDALAVVKEYLTTANDGKQYRTRFYNLDVIISVGYRVRSHVGTQFRIWATQRLRDFIVKGFALDEQRLKEQTTVADYFDELLEKIRDIRSSEKLLYKRVREICALSIDYVPNLETSQQFFASVQNKLLHAATGMTAAETVKERADHRKPNMGLTNFSGDVVRKKDVTTAKNYLSEPEIGTLNLLVAQFLDFAELQIKQRREVRMAEWLQKFDQILTLNGMSLLIDLGRVSAKLCDEHAYQQYGLFEARRGEEKARELEQDPDPVGELETKSKALKGRRTTERKGK